MLKVHGPASHVCSNFKSPPHDVESAEKSIVREFAKMLIIFLQTQWILLIPEPGIEERGDATRRGKADTDVTLQPYTSDELDLSSL